MKNITRSSIVNSRKIDAVDYFEIQVDGYLKKCWEDWFNGLEIAYNENGNTILRGPIADQSELHGILARLRDLNIKLISVKKA